MGESLVQSLLWVLMRRQLLKVLRHIGNIGASTTAHAVTKWRTLAASVLESADAEDSDADVAAAVHALPALLDRSAQYVSDRSRSSELTRKIKADKTHIQRVFENQK